MLKAKLAGHTGSDLLKANKFLITANIYIQALSHCPGPRKDAERKFIIINPELHATIMSAVERKEN